MNWERAFAAIEANAPRVPAFAKFVRGEQLSAGELAELERGARELGLYDLALFVGQVTPDVLQSMAKAHESIAAAARVRNLWEQFVR